MNNDNNKLIYIEDQDLFDKVNEKRCPDYDKDAFKFASKIDETNWYENSKLDAAYIVNLENTFLTGMIPYTFENIKICMAVMDNELTTEIVQLYVNKGSAMFGRIPLKPAIKPTIC